MSETYEEWVSIKSCECQNRNNEWLCVGMNAKICMDEC